VAGIVAVLAALAAASIAAEAGGTAATAFVAGSGERGSRRALARPILRAPVPARGVGTIVAAASPASGTPSLQVSTGDGHVTADLPLWLDVRKGREGIIDGIPVTANVLGAEANTMVNETLMELVEGVRPKLKLLGISTPPEQLIDGVLLGEQVTPEGLDSVRALGFDVYVVATNLDGVTLPRGNKFVCNTEKVPVGAVSLKEDFGLRADGRRNTVTEVWSFMPNEDKRENTEEEQAEQDAMDRYKEGLQDDSKYVPPPPKRVRELFSRSRDDQGDALNVVRGEVLARALPPEPLLWARFLVQRWKETGTMGTVTYKIKSDYDSPEKLAWRRKRWKLD